ncbi:DUF6808 domain-containing protein [uncultured Rikenella sp.]|uniref:DUF6808 domain-containing protein n=1 Tax=uncultured Rikenella sp. TaxID=368003 RepID=UPI0026329173|nr:hypothetical protein [uncultured Rikenella sp.]
MLGTLLLMRHCAGPAVVVREVVHADTVTVVRVDTVVVEKPVPVRVVERRMDTLLFERAGDTVFVPVPIAQYQFRDSLYALDVSGYGVSLDRLEVYPRTVSRTINTTTERVIKDKKRWALTVGPGIGYGPHGVQPYLGVSFGFVIWSK